MKETITLKYENENGYIVTHTFDGGGEWHTHLQSMINFLRGIGYVIPEEEDRV